MTKKNNLQSLFCGILFCISVTALVIACLAFTKKGGGEYYMESGAAKAKAAASPAGSKTCQWNNEKAYKNTIKSWMAWDPKNNCATPVDRALDPIGEALGQETARLIGKKVKDAADHKFCSRQPEHTCEAAIPGFKNVGDVEVMWQAYCTDGNCGIPSDCATSKISGACHWAPAPTPPPPSPMEKQCREGCAYCGHPVPGMPGPNPSCAQALQDCNNCIGFSHLIIVINFNL